MSIDDEVELTGENELYDLWNETQIKAVAIAEKLDLTNEELHRIEARWMAISYTPQGHPMASLAHYVLAIRAAQGLASLMKPDETMVSLTELAARHRGSKGEA